MSCATRAQQTLSPWRLIAFVNSGNIAQGTLSPEGPGRRGAALTNLKKMAIAGKRAAEAADRKPLEPEESRLPNSPHVGQGPSFDCRLSRPAMR